MASPRLMRLVAGWGRSGWMALGEASWSLLSVRVQQMAASTTQAVRMVVMIRVNR